MQAIDIVGKRFGRLTVIKNSKSRQMPCGSIKRCVIVKCRCGSQKTVMVAELRRGNTNSCGCLHREGLVRRSIKHGDARRKDTAAEYRIWQAMISRCRYPNPNYRDRGIRVCSRWRKSYQAFLRDMGRRPSQAYSIDRKKNEGNYTPRNCKWSTKKEQSNNRRPRRKR
jgi:hypothetical protein